MTTMSRVELERLLSNGLRDEALAAPMPDGLLRVPDRWVRPGTAIGKVRLVAAAGVVAAAVVGTLAVVGMLRDRGAGPIHLGAPPPTQGVEIRNFDTTPREVVLMDPTWPEAFGPIVEVARGSADRRGFRITVFRGSRVDEVCVVFDWAGNGSSGCGAAPNSELLDGLFGTGSTMSGARLPHEVFGVVSRDAAAVWVEATGGGRAETKLVDLSPAEIDAYLFVAFLPGGADATAWVATDSSGREMDRFVVASGPAPSEPDGPVPTPATPGQPTP